MGKINWARIVLGGLLAGVVINVSEFLLHGVLMREDWEVAMQNLGRPVQDTTTGMIAYVVVGFLMGIALVWLYAIARPRFGPGPRTAGFTAIGYWVIGYALPTAGLWPLGLFPAQLLVMPNVWGLGWIVFASVVGAWPYKEA